MKRYVTEKQLAKLITITNMYRVTEKTKNKRPKRETQQNKATWLHTGPNEPIKFLLFINW